MIYKSKKLSNIPWLTHGFGTRENNNSPGVRFIVPQGCDLSIPQTNQIHGNKVHILNKNIKEKLEGDAFITNKEKIVCFVRTADCVPILLCDPEKKVVGAIHAGWRGQVAGVIKNTIYQMEQNYSINSADIIASIGPAICGKCYEVGKEVVEQFLLLRGHRPWQSSSSLSFPKSFWSGIQQIQNKYFLDLHVTAKFLLEQEGVLVDNIETINQCTYCNPKEFVSFRRDKTEQGRQHNFIYIQ